MLTSLKCVGVLIPSQVLSLMTQAPHISVSLSRTASVLGYSLLPMVGLSSIAILLSLRSTFFVRLCVRECVCLSLSLSL